MEETLYDAYFYTPVMGGMETKENNESCDDLEYMKKLFGNPKRLQYLAKNTELNCQCKIKDHYTHRTVWKTPVYRFK